MNFKTVFDAAQQGYGTWWVPANGLLFVCIGILLVFKPAVMLRIMPSGLQGRARKIFGWFFLILAILGTLGIFASTFAQYRTAVTALNNGRYEIVEGPVTNFVPMPYRGHSEESFVVGGHHFTYSDYILTSGFHNTASHGGPIHEGLYVRVTYLGNLILRLEIAQ